VLWEELLLLLLLLLLRGACGVSAVAAAGAGFLRAIDSKGADNGQFQNPYGGVAFDAVGKLLNSTVIACKC
jgi:hypothetical protein